MSTSKHVHAAIEASRRADDFFVSEDHGRLNVSGSLTREALSLWQSIHALNCPWLRISCIDASEDTIAPAEAKDGERVRLTVSFTPVPGAVHLFTPEGWRSFLLDDGQVSQSAVVRLAFASGSFATKAFVVEPWAEAPAGTDADDLMVEGGPRRHVRCQASEFMAPSRIQPWLTAKEPAHEDEAWRQWASVAREMISRSLPNELYVEAGVRRASIAGQPSRQLDFGKPDQDCSLQSLQVAANWVYLEGADIEVRHTFLTSELAREWPAGGSFCQEISSRAPVALDSARLLYKAHLRSGSKDTLKALADLRKALADDVQKFTQQARDLSNAIWRDVALAIGVLAVRLAMDSTRINATSKAFAIIYLVIAFYIVVSFKIAVSTNNRFFEEFDKTRNAWRPKLYGFLDTDDYKTLADEPVAGAIAVYRSTERKIGWVVFLVVAVLLMLAFAEADFLPWAAIKDLAVTSWDKTVRA